MKKGAGSALSAAVREGRGRAARGPPVVREVLFSSAARRAVFSHLCARPCSSASQVAGALKFSMPTANWHLRKLCGAGYIKKAANNGMAVYIPAMVHSPYSLGACMALASANRAAAFRSVMAGPGQTADDIAYGTGVPAGSVKKALSELIAESLVSRVRDGRAIRYYATDGFRILCREDRKGKRAFSQWLIGRLEEEGLQPRLLRSGPESLAVEITVHRQKVSWTLKTELELLLARQ